LNMIRKVDVLAVRSTFANPTEVIEVSFYSGTTSRGAPRDICEEDLLQHDTGDWSKEILERCVDRLARCEKAKCQQDLLNLLVSFFHSPALTCRARK
jgi:hypothetical protein